MHHFSNIYFVSDNKGSWRKKLYSDYKGNRKKSEEIDWDFISTAYNEVKDDLPKNVTVLEKESVEGDDWIYQIVKMGNKEGYSNIIISNDYDMKQLLEVSINEDSSFINIMSNEKFNSEVVFLPNNYEVFLNDLRDKSELNDLFTLSDDAENLNFLRNFIEKREIKKVDSSKELLLKIISGDKSDNIPSIFSKKTKTGKLMGIGDKGAMKIYDKYVSEFGEPDIKTEEFKENLADIICESKKVSYSDNVDNIINNINLNSKLVDLDLIPDYIKSEMESKIKFK